MRHRVIFIIVTLWFLGTFFIEANDFISGLYDLYWGDDLSVVIPILSTSFIGATAWVGLFFRKTWGAFLVGVYFFLLGFSLIQDILFSEPKLYYVIVLIFFIPIAFLFTKYIEKHGGILW